MKKTSRFVKFRIECINETLNHKIKNVLDLGCGKGKLASFYSSKGLNVTGIDLKTPLFSNFKFVNQDIRKFQFKKKYDLIIAKQVLHYFSYDKALSLIRKIQKNTSSKGLNLLFCLTPLDPFYKQGDFYVNKKQLSEIYSGWKIIKLIKSGQITTDLESHGNVKPHKHNIVVILAQKI